MEGETSPTQSTRDEQPLTSWRRAKRAVEEYVIVASMSSITILRFGPVSRARLALTSLGLFALLLGSAMAIEEPKYQILSSRDRSSTGSTKALSLQKQNFQVTLIRRVETAFVVWRVIFLETTWPVRATVARLQWPRPSRWSQRKKAGVCTL